MSSDETPLVGVAGWSYQDWAGVVYPAREKDKLAFMSRYINCIEINSSFYRPFPARIAENWLESIAKKKHFRFTAKLWSRFTHQTDEPYTREEITTFKEGMNPLLKAGKLAALLVQFPFYFKDSAANRDLVKRIADDFGEFDKVLEVRDSSWGRPDAVSFLRELRYHIATLDMPLAKSSFKGTAIPADDLAYLRFHGRNYDAWFSKNAGRDERYNYLYEGKELDELLGEVKAAVERVKRLVVIWNNHFRGKALVNALQTMYGLSGKKVNVPPLLKEQYPQLASIASHQEELPFGR